MTATERPPERAHDEDAAQLAAPGFTYLSPVGIAYMAVARPCEKSTATAGDATGGRA